MSIGSEFLTSNTQIAFPFVEDSEGLTYDQATHGLDSKLPVSVIADALITAPASVSACYLDSIVASGANYMLAVVDSTGAVLVSVPVAPSGWNLTQRYQVVRNYSSGTQTNVKLLLNTQEFLAYAAGITTGDYFQYRLPFESTVLSPILPRIETFDLYTELPDPPEPDVPGSIDGRVQLLSGYNVGLFIDRNPSNAPEPETESDDSTNLSVFVAPGAGDGLAPCQTESSILYKGLMQLVPDENGDIQIVGGNDDCYNIATSEPLSLYQIQGVCAACCSCEDYENVAAAIKKLLDQSKAIKTVLWGAHHTSYNDGVTHFNTVVSARYHSPGFEANGSGGAGWDDGGHARSGAAHYASIILGLINNTQYNLQANTWTLDILPAFTVRHAVWMYNGQGAPCLNGDLSLTPVIPPGYELKLYILIHAAYPDDPTWTGIAKLNVTEIKPSGNVNWNLEDDIQFT